MAAVATTTTTTACQNHMTNKIVTKRNFHLFLTNDNSRTTSIIRTYVWCMLKWRRLFVCVGRVS